MKFMVVNAGHPDRNLSVRCAVGQSETATREKSQRDSPTATNIATSVTVMLPSRLSQNHARAS
jgi:hypothetical protein